MPAAGEIHRLKKWRLPAGFLAGDYSVKHNELFALFLSFLNLIYSRQPNFLATTLILTDSFNADYLLHKEKQIPAQLMDKWRKAALAISYASVFTTFVIGVSAFGMSLLVTSS